MMVRRAIYGYKGKIRLNYNAVLADDPLPNGITHTSELTPVYEDILPLEKQKKILRAISNSFSNDICTIIATYVGIIILCAYLHHFAE